MERPGCEWFERITSDKTAATKKRFTIAERVGNILSVRLHLRLPPDASVSAVVYLCEAKG